MSRRASSIGVRLFLLIALCVQLASSFGHLHFDADHHVASVAAQCASADRDHCPLPAHHEEEPECPICLAMSFVASAVVPGPPEIAHPILCDETAERLRRDQIAVSDTARNFQARAPPAV